MSSIISGRTIRLLCALMALALTSGIAGAAPKLYVANFADNTVSVIDTADGKVVATVPVAAGPHGMAITQDGRTVYVTGDASSALSVIDTATDRVVKTIEVGTTPNGVALTPDGKLLLVTVYGEDRIAFLDTATQAVAASVAVPKPHTVAISPDGRLPYITSQEPGRFALVVIDIAARAVIRTVPLDRPPRDAEFAYDGRALYFTQAGVNAVQVLDPASDKIVAQIPTGVSPHFVKLFRGTTLGMFTVQGPGEVVFFDPITNKPVRSVRVGRQPHWIDVSGDGKTAYVPNEGSNDVSVIDVASGNTATIAVGNAPRKVVVQKAGGQRAGADAKISIVDFAYEPHSITIRTGDSIAWSNDDGAAHTVTFRDGSAGAKSLAPGKTFTRTFERAGTYDYFCSFHPYITGQVIVNAK
jgi:YVTN family beta-propeller protein